MSAPKRLFWIEQKYVVPVYADSFEAAKDLAYRRRAAIANECGPLTQIRHDNTRFTEREGWDTSEPYGGEGRTVAEILAEPAPVRTNREEPGR